MTWLADVIRNKTVVTRQDFLNELGTSDVMGVAAVGEKAIAGPICVASVWLGKDPDYYTIAASQLNKEALLLASRQIRDRARLFKFGWANIPDLERVGQQAAIVQAAAVSLGYISRFTDLALVILDGIMFDPLPGDLPSAPFPIVSIKNASEFMEPVIAAKIVAKQARDAMMDLAHKDLPEYDWENNRGYATPMHIEAIKMHGVSPLHRKIINIPSLRQETLFRNCRAVAEYQRLRELGAD